jgi:hypothetical protein
MENVRRFKLTEQHIKLLRAAYVDYNDYCEHGAPCINPKRPYGNSFVEGDIHYILTGKRAEEELSDTLTRKYNTLHEETATALQIILATGKFQVGTYELEGYGVDWKKVK